MEAAASEQRARSRSRSPPREATAAPTAVAARGAVRSYRVVDVAETFFVKSSGKRNRTGGMIWDVMRDRTPINFHHLSVDGADKWSEVIWDIKTENDKGETMDKLSLGFRVSPEQATWLQGADNRLIDQITEKSLEVLGKATKREIVANMYPSPLMMKEGFEPAVKMAMTVRGHPAFLTTVYYYEALPEGGWAAKPIIASGWDKLEPLLMTHRCRFAKIRCSFRAGSLQVIGGKSITVRWELVELHMRAPPLGAGGSSGAFSREEMQLMQNLE